MLYYKNNLIKLYKENSLNFLTTLDNESIDVIVTDPPYFLSKGGITCKGGKVALVDKGEWDKETTITMNQFYYIFLKEAKRILKKNGTIWVSGTMHNIFSLGFILQKLKFKILNNITWQKTNPPPNLSCRMFTHSTENIIWAKRDEDSKQFFNYQLMKNNNNNKQMKDVWTSSTTKMSEKKHGKHPTQKPLEIWNRIILSSTIEGNVILDPFIGSGTTAVSAYRFNRKCIGVDINKDFLNIAKNRLIDEENKNGIYQE